MHSSKLYLYPYLYTQPRRFFPNQIYMIFKTTNAHPRIFPPIEISVIDSQVHKLYIHQNTECCEHTPFSFWSKILTDGYTSPGP